MSERYNEVNLTPSKGAQQEAKRALEWVAEFGRGGTSVGRTTARMLASGERMSPERVRRMARYFPRHEVDKQAEGFRPGEKGYPSNGRIAWALWGGDAGKSWSNSKVRQMNKIDEQYKGIAPETKDVFSTVPVTVGKDQRVRGVASVYGNLDRHGDVVLPGAFDKSLADLPDPSEVAFLWNHDTALPLGPMNSLKAGPKGLEFEGTIVPTTWGKDVTMLMDTGTVNKVSFGYKVNQAAFVDDAVGLAAALSKYSVPSAWKAPIMRESQKAFDAGMGVRLLAELEPWEVSLVPVPANPMAQAQLSKGISASEVKSAAPFRDYPMTAMDYPWEPEEAEARVREWAEAEEAPNAAYRSAFAWYDPENPGDFDSYMLQIADVIEGELALVPAAVMAAAAMLEDGGTEVPDADAGAVRSLLTRYYVAMSEAFGDDSIVPPWGSPDGEDSKEALTCHADAEHNRHGMCTDDHAEAKAVGDMDEEDLRKLKAIRSAMSTSLKALDDMLAMAGGEDEEDAEEVEGGDKDGHDDEEDEDEDEYADKGLAATSEDIAALKGLYRFS